MKENPNQVIPVSKICSLIEKSLEDQKPPQNQDLLDLFNKYLNLPQPLNAVDIAALLKSTFTKSQL